MKFIFSFLFFIILATPVFAAQCLNFSEDTCNYAAGCEFNGVACVECMYGYYNEGGTNAGCIPCPDNSSHNLTGSTSVYDCVCTDSNKHILSQNGGYVCAECPTNSYYDDISHTCKCFRGATNIGGSCSCPEHSAPNNSGHQCECDFGYNSHWNGNTLTCSNCPAHSTFVNNDCQCDAGYYGTANPNNRDACHQCPDGTTSIMGTTTRNGCYMDSNTAFCNKGGQNCMNLIPSGKIIYAGNN